MHMSSTINKRLGMLLRVLRIRCELDQQQMAARLGVTQPTVSRWENGAGLPVLRHLHGWIEACSTALTGAQLTKLKLLLAKVDAVGEPEAGLSRALDGLITEMLNQNRPVDDAWIPYFADIAARIGECQEQRTGPRRTLAVPREILERDPECYALRVVGDSMAPQLIEGDIVVISPAAVLVDGCVVAAYIEPDGDVIKLYRALKGGAVLLQPANPRYPSLLLEPGGEREARIWGRVVLSQREL